MSEILGIYVTFVHGMSAGCPDVDGGALLVYQKPGVCLRLLDLKLPSGVIFRFASLCPGKFC